MKRLVFLAVLTVMTGLNGSLFNSVIQAKEEKTIRRWPTLEQIQEKLEEWQKKHPEKMLLKEAGKSIDGNSIPLVILTDQSVPDEDKEHILVTTLHSGIERSATTSALYLIKWILSSDPVAKESLKKQVIICMPVVNPDGYLAGTFTNKKGKDPYLAWTLDGPSAPEDSPEIVAVQKIMDQYQPEVLSDMHGLDLTIDNYKMVEVSGPAYSNSALRPYHHTIPLLMEEAAVEAGFPMDRAEQDAEKLFWGPALESISHKLWLGRPRVYGAMYCYNKFHSIILTSECGWEKSAQVRQKRLLQIGNDIWPGELYPGYPTRTIMRNSFHLVTAYGVTASERRKSRVELWNKFQHFSHGMDNPQQVGKVTYVCSTSSEERNKWISDTSLKGFSEKIASHPGMNAKVIQDHLKDHPDGPGQWGDLARIYLYGKNAPSKEKVVVENGLAHLNGFPCKPSNKDGYQTWSARGYTHIQINIPPEKSRKENFWVVTLDYAPKEIRKQGWESVLEKTEF